MAKKIHGRTGMRYTVESFMITNGKAGAIFYSTQKDKDLTATASHAGRKIKTERVIVVSYSRAKPQAETVTKVTLL